MTGKACPLFVPLVEEGLLQDPVTDEIASRYLTELIDIGIDTLILGCTHYPLIRSTVGRIMGEEVTLVNPAYETAAELKKLLNYTDDAEVLKKLSCIKKSNKEALASWLEDKQGIKLNTNAMFSIQSKRLHEYKRQQLNLLFLIHEYLEIKAGHTPVTPLVSIFGAKAAPAYIIAKDIIHALLTLSQVISADSEVS